MASGDTPVDLKHLPDWRTHPAYMEAQKRLDAVRVALPDLDTAEAQAMMAASAAQDALDEVETLALANRAKPRDVELKRTALDAAKKRLQDATAAREKAQRDVRLLENGAQLLCDDARRDAAQQLSAAAGQMMERLERVMAEAVRVNEEYRALHGLIYNQFPGLPTDEAYTSAALGMPITPWEDLRPPIHGQGFINETRYTQWVKRMAEYKAHLADAAQPRPSRPTQRAS